MVGASGSRGLPRPQTGARIPIVIEKRVLGPKNPHALNWKKELSVEKKHLPSVPLQKKRDTVVHKNVTYIKNYVANYFSCRVTNFNCIKNCREK